MLTFLSPCSAGATAVRRAATKTILNAGYVDVLKGNQSEILTCTPSGASLQQRGVDSSADASLTQDKLAATVRELAQLRRATVVMTGETDLVSGGGAVYAVGNGHEYLGVVTGTGCCLGTTVSAMVAAYPEDKVAATVAGLLLYEIAAEVAAERDDVRGPGTFVPAFLDELFNLRKQIVRGEEGWLKRAKLSVLA